MERIRIRCSECLGYCEDVRPVLEDGISARCVQCGNPICFRDVLVWELAQFNRGDLLSIIHDASELSANLIAERRGFDLAVDRVCKNGMGKDGGKVNYED